MDQSVDTDAQPVLLAVVIYSNESESGHNQTVNICTSQYRYRYISSMGTPSVQHSAAVNISKSSSTMSAYQTVCFETFQKLYFSF